AARQSVAAALSGQTPPDRVGSGLRQALERRLQDGWVASPLVSTLLPGSASRSAIASPCCVSSAQTGRSPTCPRPTTWMTHCSLRLRHQPVAPDHRAPEVADASGGRSPGLTKALGPLVLHMAPVPTRIASVIRPTQ